MSTLFQIEKTDDFFNTTTYETDFYSGSQISIYIGNILVDDIAAINFTVQQGKRPLYGYASQYYHTLSKGQIIVEGSFMLAFKESGYLPIVLDNYMKMSPLHQNEDKTDKLFARNIEQTRALRRLSATNPAFTNPDLETGNIQILSELNALNDTEFENIAETFQEKIWNNRGNNRDFLGSGSDDWRRADQYPPFDIYITYGDVENDAANHTVKRLVGCAIIGNAQTIESNGQPVYEVYSFLAQNLI